MRNRRAPLAARIPRPAKLRRDRYSAGDIPAYIFTRGTRIDDDQRADLRRRLGRKLGKFARAVERVSVRVRDVNGPRGGVDKACAIKVVLVGLPSVVVEEQHRVLRDACDAALRHAERAVRRAHKRRVLRGRSR